MSGISGSSEYGDVLEDVAVQTTITITTTATELIVSGSPENERELIRVYNNGPQKVYIGFNNSVTAAGANQGEPLFKNQWIEYPFGPDLTLYAITASSTADVTISELG
jgi:hypothetical protein